MIRIRKGFLVARSSIWWSWLVISRGTYDPSMIWPWYSHEPISQQPACSPRLRPVLPRLENIAFSVQAQFQKVGPMSPNTAPATRRDKPIPPTTKYCPCYDKRRAKITKDWTLHAFCCHDLRSLIVSWILKNAPRAGVTASWLLYPCI